MNSRRVLRKPRTSDPPRFSLSLPASSTQPSSSASSVSNVATNISKPMRKTLIERVRHFTFSWFAACMGTGAISQILHNFPYGSKAMLSRAAATFFALDALLFIIFSAMSIARYILFPNIWRRMIRHPVQSMFIGTVPMAFVTLINGALNLQQDFELGDNFLYAIWIAWWIDIFFSFMSCYVMVYLMITTQRHSLEDMLATWLVPIVPLVVVATTGALISRAMLPIYPQHVLLTIIVCAVSLMTGLTLAFMVITVYLLRLIVYGLPAKGFIVSKFLPLGPLGQGGTAFILITEVISSLGKAKLLPPPFFNDPAVGEIIRVIGIVLAFFLWSNGVFWAYLAATSIGTVFVMNKVPFGVPFWGMTFPIGVFVLLNFQLGVTLDSMFFRILGVISGSALFVLWTCIMTKTILLTGDGSIFYDPCLDDDEIKNVSIGMEDKPGDGINH